MLDCSCILPKHVLGSILLISVIFLVVILDDYLAGTEEGCTLERLL